MRKAENVNAPMLGGWLIGVAAGLVAFGALIVIGDIDFTPAAAIGIAVALLAGLILGMPWGAVDTRHLVQATAPVEPVAPPRTGDVMPEAMAAAFVSAPGTAGSAPAAKSAAPAKGPVKAKTKADPKVAAKPKSEARSRSEAKPKAAKPAKPAGPERLTAPRNGKADDLKEIEGIGPALEKLANSLGFFHFDQISSWTDADVDLVDTEMKTFKGRITRDKWVSQANIIVTEGLEAFRERAKTNNY